MLANARTHPHVTPTAASGQGWEDFLAGKPFPAEYDSWGEVHQRNYERGRLRAAGARLVWPRGRIPAHEPRDIVARTNGLRLVPPRAVR